MLTKTGHKKCPACGEIKLAAEHFYAVTVEEYAPLLAPTIRELALLN
jgi:hypothetical protein